MNPLFARVLMGKARPALRPAAGQHLATVGIGHPLAEPVHLFAMQLFGLVSSQHGFHSP